jgi:hypothetical protein
MCGSLIFPVDEKASPCWSFVAAAEPEEQRTSYAPPRRCYSSSFSMGVYFSPGHTETRAEVRSYIRGLNEADRVGSLVPPGSKDGFFDAIYVFQNERLFDSLTQPSMRSRHKTLTRTSAGYKLYWAKYGAPGMSVLPSTLIHAPWVTRRLFQPTDRSR